MNVLTFVTLEETQFLNAKPIAIPVATIKIFFVLEFKKN